MGGHTGWGLRPWGGGGKKPQVGQIERVMLITRDVTEWTQNAHFSLHLSPSFSLFFAFFFLFRRRRISQGEFLECSPEYSVWRQERAKKKKLTRHVLCFMQVLHAALTKKNNFFLLHTLYYWRLKQVQKQLFSCSSQPCPVSSFFVTSLLGTQFSCIQFYYCTVHITLYSPGFLSFFSGE